MHKESVYMIDTYTDIQEMVIFICLHNPFSIYTRKSHVLELEETLEAIQTNPWIDLIIVTPCFRLK